MINIDVKYPYGKRPLTAGMKKRNRQYEKQLSNVCMNSANATDFAKNADDFHLRHVNRKAFCVRKSLNTYGRRALSVGNYLVSKQIKAEANKLARSGKVVDPQGNKILKVCNIKGDYRGKNKNGRVGKCLAVTAEIRRNNRSKTASLKNALGKKQSYKGMGKGACVVDQSGNWKCRGNIIGQINSVASYANMKIKTLPEAEKLMRSVIPIMKLVVPKGKITIPK